MRILKLIRTLRWHTQFTWIYARGRGPWCWCSVCGAEAGNWNPWRQKFVCPSCCRHRKRLSAQEL